MSYNQFKPIIMSQAIKKRLEELRVEIRAERISIGEIIELQSLAKHIDANDVELLQWAGVEENTEYPLLKAVIEEWPGTVIDDTYEEILNEKPEQLKELLTLTKKSNIYRTFS